MKYLQIILSLVFLFFTISAKSDKEFITKLNCGSNNDLKIVTTVVTHSDGGEAFRLQDLTGFVNGKFYKDDVTYYPPKSIILHHKKWVCLINSGNYYLGLKLMWDMDDEIQPEWYTVPTITWVKIDQNDGLIWVIDDKEENELNKYKDSLEFNIIFPEEDYIRIDE